MLFHSVMLPATCLPTSLEKRRPLLVDALVPEPIFASTHAITIDNADVTNYNLEAVSVPTLIAHTRFVSLESGGHLVLGQQKKDRDELALGSARRRQVVRPQNSECFTAILIHGLLLTAFGVRIRRVATPRVCAGSGCC